MSTPNESSSLAGMRCHDWRGDGRIKWGIWEAAQNWRAKLVAKLALKVVMIGVIPVGY